MEKILITPKEAGHILSISENKVRELCKNDPEFPCIKNGVSCKVLVSGLEKWAEEKCRKHESL